MDQFLESIADAVSHLVLLSESDGSMMFVNLGPGAEAVVSATQLLVGIGEEIKDKFITNDMKEKMEEAINGIKLSSHEITHSVALLQQDQASSVGRKRLAKAAKIILSSTVMALQLTDLFECVRLIKQAKRVRNGCKALVSTTLYSEFAQLAQDFVMDSVDLAQLVVARVQFILDPVCKRKLEESNGFIRNQTQTFLTTVNAVFQNPYDPSLVDYRTIISTQFENAIEEIINAARLSSKSMLEACSLDLRMLDAEGKLATDIKDFVEDSGLGNFLAPDQLEGVDDLRSLLGGLMKAAKEGDVQTVLNTLQQLQQHSADASSSVARAVLIEEITQAVRALALDPDEMALQSLQELVDFSLMGLDALAPPPLPASAAPKTQVANIDKDSANRLNDAVSSVQIALQRLQFAVGNGTTQEAASAARETITGLTSVAEMSISIAGTCDGLNPGPELERLGEETKSHAPLLVAKTKASLADPKNQLVKEDFDLAVDKVYETTNQIKKMMDKAIKGGGAADLIKRQIADTTKEIDDVIALMMEAAKSGSTAAVADSARQLDQLMKQKTKLVQSLKECEEDSTMRSKIAMDDDSLCALIPPLIQTAHQILANPTDPALLQKSLMLTGEMKYLSALLESHAHPSMSPETVALLMEGASQLEHDFLSLQNAAKSGQAQAVVAAARQLMSHADQQAKIAATLRDQTEDSRLAAKIALECESIPPLIPPMIASAKYALQNAADPGSSLRLVATVKQGRDANARVIESFSKMPTSLKGDLEKLKKTVDGNNASNDEILEALDPLRASLGQQVRLARALATTLDEADKQQRLIRAADDMNECLDTLSGLLQEALDNPFATLDSQKVNYYIQKAATAYQVVVESSPQSLSAQYLAASKQGAAQSYIAKANESKDASYDDELLQALEAVSVSAPEPVPIPAPKAVTYHVLQGAAKSLEEAAHKVQEVQVQVARQSILITPSTPVYEQVVGFAKLSKSKFAECDGTLSAVAKIVAQEMNKLSTATTTSVMIGSAREISNAIAEICTLAQAQADLCADQKLRDQLLTVAVSLRSFSVQLKIMSAVKAASEVDEVSSAQSQLVTCGTNLANGVIKIIDYSKIAALKKKKL